MTAQKTSGSSEISVCFLPSCLAELSKAPHGIILIYEQTIIVRLALDIAIGVAYLMQCKFGDFCQIEAFGMFKIASAAPNTWSQDHVTGSKSQLDPS